MIQLLWPPVNDFQDSRPATGNLGHQTRRIPCPAKSFSQHCTQHQPSDQLAYPPRSSACQTPSRGSSANLQDVRPARTTSLRQLPTSSASRLAKQQALVSKRKCQPGASLRGSSLTSSHAMPPKRPTRLRLEVLFACNFVNQLRRAKYSPNPQSAARNS